MDDNELRQRDSRRLRLMGIVDKNFARDNVAVMRAIQQQTGQDVSVRSIQCWLIDPRKNSHRAVPDWALRGLEDFIVRPDKQDELKRMAERVEARRAIPMRFDSSDDVEHSRAVEMATNEVEDEARENKRWRDQFGTVAGDMLAAEMRAMRKEISSMSKGLAAISRAIRVCDSYDDFRKQAEDAIRDADRTAHHVRETREASEKGAGEFSRPDGLPPGASQS